MTSIDVVLFSLLLTLNIFHTFYYCFYCWLWVNNCLLRNRNRYLEIEIFFSLFPQKIFRYFEVSKTVIFYLNIFYLKVICSSTLELAHSGVTCAKKLWGCNKKKLNPLISLRKIHISSNDNNIYLGTQGKFGLSHLQPFFHLCRNQVVGFYFLNDLYLYLRFHSSTDVLYTFCQ